MQEKKRLFSGFDIAVVAIVVLAALAWFFVINREATVEVPTFDGRTTYYLEVMNLTSEQVALVSVGDALQENVRHMPIGTVIAIETMPQLMRVDDDETQTIRWEEAENRYTMILTVETEVRETAQEILAEGQVAIRGGQHPVHFAGPGYAFAFATILALARGA